MKTYKEILKQAQSCKDNVKQNYKLGITPKWSYYFAKALVNPKKDIQTISIDNAPKQSHTNISRQVTSKQYLSLAKKYYQFVESKHRLPNYLRWGNYKISIALCTYTFARCLVYYDKHGKYDNEITVNQKVFNKPSEPSNEVYTYFKKVFGDFGDTIDGALKKINGNGYGGYSDDRYSNKTSIDRMKKGVGINCTDSCHVFYNIILVLIKKGKYKKVECLHVQCSSGTGHVRLRITLKDGSKILRDPASVLDGNGVTSNWCTSNYELWAIDPSWFMENLNR